MSVDAIKELERDARRYRVLRERAETWPARRRNRWNWRIQPFMADPRLSFGEAVDQLVADQEKQEATKATGDD